MASNESPESGSNPSMIHGHAAYVAAAAKVRINTTVIATASSLLQQKTSYSLQIVQRNHEITAFDHL